MYEYIGDFHTHSCVSQHAYSTIQEMALAAKGRGFRAFAVTDHGPGLFDGALRHHFLCMKSLPDYIEGLRFFKGVEANIMDYDGGLDLDKTILADMDFIVASYHVECIIPSNVADHTKGWIEVIESGLVDCLGHCGNPVFPFEHRTVVEACAEHGIAIEINNNSFEVRPGSAQNCRKVLELCLDYDVPVMVNSDAHSMWSVGVFDQATKFLEDMGVPQSRILNCNYEATCAFIEKRKEARGKLV